MLYNTTTQYKQHSRSIRNFRKSDLPAIVIYKCNKIAIFAILRPLVSHVPERVETSIFFWYILRWTRLHKKNFKFLGQGVPEIYKVKNRDFHFFSVLYRKILQNQKVCWLLPYHDSFISILQIYAQK